MLISLDKVMRSLSIALDLSEKSSQLENNKDIITLNTYHSEHKFSNHSKRVTYIAMELCRVLSLDNITTKEVYLAALIHDIGKVNTTSYDEKDHCINGSSTVKIFPIFNNISDIILYHHENFDGSGPMKLIDSEIPIASQVIHLSDYIDNIYNDNIASYIQRDALIESVYKTMYTKFSYDLVTAFLKASSKDVFWFNLESISYMDFILDKNSPIIDTAIGFEDFLKMADIFSKLIDDKSKFTAKHSREIAKLAYLVSKHIGYEEDKCFKMKLAGLLHDIGKLAIPTSILDKPDGLTADEFALIKSHSYYTKLILGSMEDIPEICEWASNHHEKLNSKGYPLSLTSQHISEECRILCVCDIYQALTEDRPYRRGLDIHKTFTILEDMVKEGFICGDAVGHLRNTLNYTAA